VRSLNGCWIDERQAEGPQVQLREPDGQLLHTSPLARVYKMWEQDPSSDLTSLLLVLERLVRLSRTPDGS
jgi:hypothetical protein